GAHGQVMVCGVCSMQGHASNQCPQLMEEGGQEGVNAIGFQQGYQRPRNDPYSNTYNPGWRDHPNFRWKDNENTQSAPQGFQPRQTHHGNQINAISTDVNEMKKQMSQVVEFMGKFHEQDRSNAYPKGLVEDVLVQ
ncbi:hypothetical protein ABKV19_019984, partial [Rosa sericea]